MWHIINHWTLDVLHSSSNFHTSMHLTEHLSLITSIMVAVGGNQRTNVTWKKVLPLTHAALHSSLAHLEPLATSLCTLSKLHFFLRTPVFLPLELSASTSSSGLISPHWLMSILYSTLLVQAGALLQNWVADSLEGTIDIRLSTITLTPPLRS